MSQILESSLGAGSKQACVDLLQRYDRSSPALSVGSPMSMSSQVGSDGSTTGQLNMDRLQLDSLQTSSSMSPNVHSLDSTGEDRVRSMDSDPGGLTSEQPPTAFEEGLTRGEHNLATVASVTFSSGEKLYLMTSRNASRDSLGACDIGATVEVSTSPGEWQGTKLDLPHDRSPPTDRAKPKIIKTGHELIPVPACQLCHGSACHVNNNSIEPCVTTSPCTNTNAPANAHCHSNQCSVAHQHCSLSSSNHCSHGHNQTCLQSPCQCQHTQPTTLHHQHHQSDTVTEQIQNTPVKTVPVQKEVAKQAPGPLDLSKARPTNKTAQVKTEHAPTSCKHKQTEVTQRREQTKPAKSSSQAKVKSSEYI